MSKLLGNLTLGLSIFLMTSYLVAMVGFFSYFAWFNVEEVRDWRCYASQDKNVFTPSLTDGAHMHDITTNFQLVNNFGAIIFFMLLCGYL